MKSTSHFVLGLVAPRIYKLITGSDLIEFHLIIIVGDGLADAVPFANGDINMKVETDLVSLQDDEQHSHNLVVYIHCLVITPERCRHSIKTTYNLRYSTFMRCLSVDFYRRLFSFSSLSRAFLSGDCSKGKRIFVYSKRNPPLVMAAVYGLVWVSIFS